MDEYEPKGVIVVKDPAVAKLFSDQLRRQILHLVTHKEMSATDLVKAVDRNYSSVVYHLRQLEDAGLVVKARTEIVQNKLQPYYRAAAYSFHVSYYLDETMVADEEYRAWQEDLMNRLMKALDAYGLEVDPENRPRVRELLQTLYIGQKKEFEGRQEMRVTGVQLEPHVGKSIAHILANVRLLKDDGYRRAAEELVELLGL